MSIQNVVRRLYYAVRNACGEHAMFAGICAALLLAAAAPEADVTEAAGVYVYHVHDGQGRRDFVSVLPPERMSRAGGLPGVAIVGKLRKRIDEGGDVTPDNLEVNARMVEYLHAFIARVTTRLDSLREAARAAQAKGDRWILYIDGRTSKRVDVPPEDLLGQFEVTNGEITAWHRNPKHRVLHDSGIFRLDPETAALYLDALAAEPVD